MSHPNTRSAGRGKSASKRPAYLNDYVLDFDQDEPPTKSPRLHRSVEAFEDAEEPNPVDQDLQQQIERTPEMNEPEEPRMELSQLLSLMNSVKASVDSMRTENHTNMENLQSNMQAQIDSMRNQIESMNVQIASVSNVQPPSAFALQSDSAPQQSISSATQLQESTAPQIQDSPAPQLQDSSTTQLQDSSATQPQTFPSQPYYAPASIATTISNPSLASFISGRRILIDLPAFEGEFDQWPIFIADFEDSTASEGYNTLQNNSRLKKCLKGKARKCVESMLIHHQNVPAVIERLRTRFGDPEKIIKAQFDKVKAVPPITEHKLDLLVSFADDVNNMKNVLRSCNSEHCLTNSTLLEELVLKLPYSKRWEWQKHKATIKPHVTIEHFSEWLNEQATVADGIPTTSSVLKTVNPKKEKGRVMLVKAGKTKFNCILCKLDHKTASCDKFIQMPLDERWNFVSKEKVCFKCVEKGHRGNECKQKPCGVNECRRPHHKLLHKDRETPSNLNASAEPFQPPIGESNESNQTAVVMNSLSIEEPNVLFKVIPVILYGPKGEKNTFAVVDEAATLTLVDKGLATQLGLRGEKGSISIKGIDHLVKVKDTEIVDTKISGTFSQAPVYDLKGVRIVDGLDLPMQCVDLKALCQKFNHLKNSPIQDFNALPQILIGLKHAHLGAPMNVPLHNGNGPILIQTKLGYLLYGPTDDSDVCERDVQRVLLTNMQPALDELHDMVQRHYSVEDFGVKNVEQVQSSEERRAIEILEKTTRRIEGGFESGLIWAQDNSLLPNSYSMAKKRFLTIERKMTKDELYADLYKRTMADYLKKGYARELTLEENQHEPERTWYLPHFGVVNPNKPNKFRLVFDGAATVNKISLNSQLLTGPDLNQPLVKVLWRFRERTVGICGDIREMYHQIKIISKDQSAQRFLWRWTPDQPLKKYVMDSMTFGSTSSPTTAQFVKNKNALEFRDEYPAAVDAILHSHYVDDYVCCYSSEEEAIRTTREVVHIHSKGGFELRNFTSNSQMVVKALNGNSISTMSMDIDPGNAIDKILGLHWNVSSDTFTFQLKFSRIPKDILDFRRRPTKREMLSFAMSIYDPFGFIANLSIHIKLLTQAIWRAGISWDDSIPNTIYNKWCLWLEQLEKVTQVNIPRCYSPSLFNANIIELHTLVDASEVAFCAVSYFRIVVEDRTELSFVAGKTKCAPLKELSVPRLELQAAVLGIRLMNAIKDSHSFRIHQCFFWSDSMTVLYWLKDNRCRFKPFVRNRVSEILETSDAHDWLYVPTEQNVADDSTRDVYPPMFMPQSRWTDGPDWLLNKSTWPKQPQQFCSEAPVEEVHRVMLVNKFQSSLNVADFSDFRRLKRTVAWILRFVYMMKSKGSTVTKGELLPSEMNRAEQYLCRQAQKECFQEDYEHLQLQSSPNRKLNSNLVKLMPHIDENGLMRVSGRIDNAPTLPVFTKRPIILPKEHPVTFLIVKYYHELHHHQMDELTICEVRYRFWVISLRTVLQQVKKRCSFCIQRRATPVQPMMGQLPEDRLMTYVRPFSYCGVDYFGPVNVTIGRRREKRWVALFTCATIRAVHLEISENLSSDAFILCLRNFINLRGVPVRLRSDNGTNFIGARNEIIKSSEFFGDAGIQRDSTDRGIEWLFNTPGYPEAGGIWERLVQTVKRILNTLLKDVAPRVETLRSALLEAANIVNSRPLTHLPISHYDEDPLTPNSFILGVPNSIQTLGPTDERLWCLRKQWRIAQSLKNHFYKRFNREYLPTIIRREKWCERAEPIKIGDIVLMCEDDVPRGSWRKGTVEDVVMAKDGQVRTAIVKVNGSTFRRAASKLAVLDIKGRLPLDQDTSTGGGMSPIASK